MNNITMIITVIGIHKPGVRSVFDTNDKKLVTNTWFLNFLSFISNIDFGG